LNNNENYYYQDEKMINPYLLKGECTIRIRTKLLGFSDYDIDDQFLDVFYIIN